MLYVMVGAAGFLSVALYDLSQIRGTVRSGSVFSSIGYLAILASMIFLVATTRPAPTPPLLLFIKALLSLTFLSLLIYSVVIEIPRAQRKRGMSAEPASHEPVVVDTGFYALVRHPGFLWFALLWATIVSVYHNPEVTTCGVVLVVLDLLLIAVEDLVVFPRIFPGYDEYKRRVPFLIPRLRRV